ncbi:DUF1127 domain-containing protein [Oceanibium sediminis]|uniref:DUF1127 domain-containing protein n=1 Tax=Oceanibium sediminis TaxID=2026339 RepID=UPI0034D4950F
MRDPADAPPRHKRLGLIARLMRLDSSARQRHGLAQLSDHMLRDIGLDPGRLRKGRRW